MATKRSAGVNDLVMMNTISESNIVTNLRKRYEEDQIYTNIGPVLISVNPFRNIPGAYTDAVIRRYKGRNAFELQPHLYALADETYRNMISYRENQCIIITGESGSGKTEASKIIMQFISACTGKGVKAQSVKDKLLASNPVLEAFGNAKTVNNDNSSRFGKYMKIQFNGRGDPIGGSVNNYLLEKVRVVDAGIGERSFHIFYQMCAGLSAEQRDRYQIYEPTTYAYLANSNCFTIEGTDDAKDFNDTFTALQSLGATPDEIDSIMTVLSAILWLGNITFNENHQEQSSVADPQILNLVASFLQVNAQDLERALCERTLQTGYGNRAEVFHKPLTAKDAYISRDTLAKSLYDKLFNWIVAKVNQSITIGNADAATESDLIHIGLLDIYGFEIFQNNSFEQLCINFVNERLQQIFIDLTLKAEQDEYEREGIPWTPIEYYNNLPCVQMIEGRPGLFTLLDDACHTSKTDAMFVNEIGTYFGDHQHIQSSQGRFQIAHYAGYVEYEASGFLIKNKDTLFDDLILVIQGSQGSFSHHHGWNQVPVARDTQRKKPPTVGRIFKQQVIDLMAALHECTPHYVRCIKPNKTKRGKDFNSDYTANQVRYLGLLENVRVRRAGYAIRMPFDRFIQRFGMLSNRVWNHTHRSNLYAEPWRYVEDILQQFGWVDKREYSMGQTKVFVRQAESVFRLEDARETLLNRSAAAIQRVFKRHRNKRECISARSFCHEQLQNRKERRSNSIDAEYHGDYINASGNPEYRAQIGDEKLLFADRVTAIELVGKRNLLQSLKRAVSKKNVTEARSSKQILLTTEALYCVQHTFDEVSERTVTSWEFRVPLTQLSRVTLSNLCDNVVLLWSNLSATPTVFVARRKVELAGLLKQTIGQSLTLDIAQQPVPVQVQAKNGKLQQCLVHFIREEMMQQEATIALKKNGDVHVRVGNGIAPSQFPAPPKPRAIDWNAPVRDELEVLYDFKGNGIDELSVVVGDKLSLLEDDGDGWLRAECRGTKGYIPESYVKRVRMAAHKTRPSSSAAAANTRGHAHAHAHAHVNANARDRAQPRSAVNKQVSGMARQNNKVRFQDQQQITNRRIPGDSSGFALPKLSGASKPIGSSATPQNRTGARWSNAAAPKTDWEKVLDESSGAYYYFNGKTGESSWEKPSEVQVY